MSEPTLREHLKAMLDAPLSGVNGAAAVKSNGHDKIVQRWQSQAGEQATAVAFLETSEGGRQALRLLDLLFGQAADVLIEHGVVLRELRKENAKLEAELATKMAYSRIWTAEAAYKLNDVTTYRGQLWCCEQPNSGVRPGSDGCWRLMHKRENL
jgi:hypothetical protein